MKPQLSNWLASSQNPEEISNTVRGIILGASSFIVALGAVIFHIQLTADNVTSLATGVGMLAGGIWFVYGLVMKGVVRMGSVR